MTTRQKQLVENYIRLKVKTILNESELKRTFFFCDEDFVGSIYRELTRQGIRFTTKEDAKTGQFIVMCKVDSGIAEYLDEKFREIDEQKFEGVAYEKVIQK